MGKIIKKHYLKITFQLDSPLCIGSGRNDITDQDILRDARGIPYIPGSAVAGVLREACQGIMDDKAWKYYFGYSSTNTGNKVKSDNDIIESQIIFYDATLVGDNKDKDGNPKYRISQRDGVALNEYKSAKKQAKFDQEILEGDCKFQTFIEISEEQSDVNEKVKADEVLTNIAKIWKETDIRFGAKTTRGYGKICNVEIIGKNFDFTSKDEISSWLDFNIFEENSWENAILYEDMLNTLMKDNIWTLKDNNRLSLKLRLEGGLSIRRYSTECSDEESSPDQEQLTTLKFDKNGSEEVAVIPGTTWAGAIGHRMEELIDCSKVKKVERGKDDIQTYNYFGTVNSKVKEKSLIYFNESKLTGGQFKKMSRNAIDRFLGSTAEGALFTEKIYIGGETTLDISFGDPYDTAVVYSDDFINALAATLTDLHEGYLAVGGATSVGRGIFSILKINGVKLNECKLEGETNSVVFDKLYETLKALIGKKETENGTHKCQK
ncbi:CRISPR-associated RAMP protein [Lachnospiraceae bacterium oral taxon 082 str. F0431]|nr:CRISPR-associated RAMP protein [Lachnospiraceae bacterium oral taxon 082 str. F0431]